MRMSFNTSTFIRHAGYGEAGYQMITHLQALGYQVPFDDANAPIHMDFCQPQWWTGLGRNQYHIGYVPWESSKLDTGWLPRMNAADEIWTPSPLIAAWYEQAGVSVPVKVFEHGISDEWTAKKRYNSGKIRILHHGEPAPRKCGQMVTDAFIAAFNGHPDVSLTIKGWQSSNVRVKNASGVGSYAPDQLHKNIKVIIEDIPTEELVSLYHSHHLAVLPSWGEGFGFIPLQALVTGMPTITNSHIFSYKRFILPELDISCSLDDSPWPDMHPGKMYKPSFDDLVDRMRYAVDNIDTLSGKALLNSTKVRRDYRWPKVIKIADKYLKEIDSKIAVPAGMYDSISQH